jgi:tetratricopeptide (TPR) repeat protein
MTDLPNSSELLNRIFTLLDLKRFDRAEESLEQYLSIDPHCARAYCAMVIIYQHTHRATLAIDPAKKAVAMDPHDSFAYYILASAYKSNLSFLEAEQKIAIAIRLDSQIADYFALQTDMYQMQNRWHESIASLENGLRLDPSQIDCLKIKCKISIERRSFTDASKTVHLLLRLAPNDSGIHFLNGEMYRQQQQHRQAISAYQESLRLNPHQTELQEFLRNYIHQQILSQNKAEQTAKVDNTQTQSTDNKPTDRAIPSKVRQNSTKVDREYRERVTRVYETKAVRVGETEAEAEKRKQQDKKYWQAAVFDRFCNLFRRNLW